MLTYTYVDNSNLFIEGQRVAAVNNGLARNMREAMDNGILDHSWNVDYGKLHQLLCGTDRAEIGGARLWGSPPPGDQFWNMVRTKGFEVQTYDKSVTGTEKKVDVAIAHRMTKDAYTIISKAKKSSELVLVSGDKDFVPVVQDLVQEGFTVVVAFWDHAATELKAAASQFYSLNQHHALLKA